MREAVRLPIVLSPLAPGALVSVLTPSYNHARFVGSAIESVLLQTYANLELIICDDGSTDESCEVIRGYVERDVRVRLITQTNRGAAAALNTAYQHARGEVLCLLDSDDRFAPDKLRCVTECLRAENAGLLHHAMISTDSEGKALFTLAGFGSLERGWLASKLQRRGGRWLTQASSALCLRRECAAYIFPIPEQLGSFGYDAFIQTLAPLLAPVAAIDAPLSYYRIHPANQLHGRRVDTAILEQYLTLERSVNAFVNERLEAFGRGDQRLDLTRNLHLQEHLLSLALLRGSTSRLDLVREFAPLLRATLGDDMLGRYSKVRSLLTLALAIPLPVAWRGRWLTQLFEPTSRVRHALRTTVERLRQRRRAASGSR